MRVPFLPKAYKSSRASKGVRFVSTKITERNLELGEAGAIIGISPSGVRLLLDNKKLGYYQSGRRRIIGETHLTEYLSKIERNNTKAKIY